MILGRSKSWNIPVMHPICLCKSVLSSARECKSFAAISTSLLTNTIKYTYFLNLQHPFSPNKRITAIQPPSMWYESEPHTCLNQCLQFSKYEISKQISCDRIKNQRFQTSDRPFIPSDSTPARVQIRSKPFPPSSFPPAQCTKHKGEFELLSTLLSIRKQSTFLNHEIPIAAFQEAQMTTNQITLLKPTFTQLNTAQKQEMFGFNGYPQDQNCPFAIKIPIQESSLV